MESITSVEYEHTNEKRQRVARSSTDLPNGQIHGVVVIPTLFSIELADVQFVAKRPIDAMRYEICLYIAGVFAGLNAHSHMILLKHTMYSSEFEGR